MSGRHQATAPKFSIFNFQFSIRTHTLASYPRRKDAVLGIGFVGCKEKITILQNISDKKTITQKR